MFHLVYLSSTKDIVEDNFACNKPCDSITLSQVNYNKLIYFLLNLLP